MTDDREPLSGPDNAWLQMGRIENLTNITGMLVFEERVEYETLVERLDERLLRFDRFRQRVHGGIVASAARSGSSSRRSTSRRTSRTSRSPSRGVSRRSSGPSAAC
jgi:hypothetical protein